MLGAAGCGAEEPDGDAAAREDGEVVDISGSPRVGDETAGSVAQLVECTDWKEADPDERIGTLADVRSHINLEDTGVSAPELTDEEAFEIFDNVCEPAHAAGFRLYLIYARAIGFAELGRALDE